MAIFTVTKATLDPECLHCAILRAIAAHGQTHAALDILNALAAVAAEIVAPLPPALRNEAVLNYGAAFTTFVADRVADAGAPSGEAVH